MKNFVPGDRVHFAGLGSGVVREVRSGGRYVVEIKGRAVVASGNQLEAAEGTRTPRKANKNIEAEPAPSTRTSAASPSLDLHGKTVDEAVQALETFINDALLQGSHEVRVIHGRSGGRIKTAVHQYLRRLPIVAAFRLDPHNPGATIVTFA